MANTVRVSRFVLNCLIEDYEAVKPKIHSFADREPQKYNQLRKQVICGTRTTRKVKH